MMLATILFCTAHFLLIYISFLLFWTPIWLLYAINHTVTSFVAYDLKCLFTLLFINV